MLVAHLGSRLLGEVQQSQKFSVVEGREVETHEKMRIFQAFKIQKGVSSCGYLQLAIIMHHDLYIHECIFPVYFNAGDRGRTSTIN